MTTPPSMQVLPIKRPNRCGIGARYCDALCAAKMTQFLYRLSCSFRLSVAAVARNCARASCTTWCGDKRTLCAKQRFGWVTNVFDYRSNGAALCCALSHQHWWTHPFPIVVRYALVVAVPGARNGAGRLARCHSFESQTVWSVCSAVRTVLLKDARQMHAAVDSGCNENVRQMCELPNYGRVIVATEVMALWRRSGDGRALRTHAPLAMERRTIHSDLSVAREES